MCITTFKLMQKVTRPLLFNTLFLLVVGLLIVGCDSSVDSGDETQSDEDVLMPLADGNMWEAQAIPEASSTPDDPDETGTLTVSGETRVIDSREFKEIIVPPGSEPIFYVYQDENGLYFSDTVGDVEEIDMFFPYPVEDGTSYTHENAFGSFEVTAEESSITVPAGDFETVRYRIDEGPPFHIHFKPGIGPVAWLDGLRGPEGSLDNLIDGTHLVSYDID